MRIYQFIPEASIFSQPARYPYGHKVKISSRNKKYKEEDTPSVKPSGSGLEVIGSAIKNDKYQGSTGPSV